MPLSSQQKAFLKSSRQSQKEEAVTLWTLTKTDSNPDDYYATQTITSGARLMSGSVAWTNRAQRFDASGGFYETGDVELILSKTEQKYFESGIGTDPSEMYVVVDDVELRISKVTGSKVSDEIVVSCNRYR